MKTNVQTSPLHFLFGSKGQKCAFLFIEIFISLIFGFKMENNPLQKMFCDVVYAKKIIV